MRPSDLPAWLQILLLLTGNLRLEWNAPPALPKAPADGFNLRFPITDEWELPPPDATLVTKGEFARRQGVGRSTVSNWITSGLLSRRAVIGNGQRAPIWVERAEADLLLTRTGRHPRKIFYAPAPRLIKNCVNCGEEFNASQGRKICDKPECKRGWKIKLSTAWQAKHPEKKIEANRRTQIARTRARTVTALQREKHK